jgi:hypothetical protein
MVFDKFPERRLAAERATGTAQNIVAVWKEASKVGWREWRGDGEDVPYVLCGI